MASSSSFPASLSAEEAKAKVGYTMESGVGNLGLFGRYRHSNWIGGQRLVGGSRGARTIDMFQALIAEGHNQSSATAQPSISHYQLMSSPQHWEAVVIRVQIQAGDRHHGEVLQQGCSRAPQ